MALQSQTHPNSGNAYYITNYAPSFNPSTNVSLRSPVEIIFTSSIQTEFYGYMDQTPSTFTLSENNANLSTVNSLVFDPVVPKTTMNVYDVNNAIAEPVIQQWSLTSSIVNGIFKVGNKALNDIFPLNMVNGGNQTVLTQGNNTEINIDGNNQRVIYSAVASPSVYVGIGTGIGSIPVANVRCANDPSGAAVQMSPTQVSFNGGAGATIPYGRTGVGNIAPNTYYMTARTGIDFVTDDVNAVVTPLSLKQDGTATMISTLNVPVLRQGNITQTIDNTNTRTRFNNVVDGGFSYTEINQIAAAPSVIVLNTQAQTKITPSTIAISNFSASPSQVAKIGTIPSFPQTFMLESYRDTQIRTNLAGFSTATFKENGTTELLSTLKVPFISTTNLQANTISSVNIDANDISCIRLFATTISSVNINATNTSTTNLQANTISSVNINATNTSTTNLQANTISSVNIDANDISCIRLFATTISSVNINATNTSTTNLLASTLNTVNLNTSSILTSTITTNTLAATTISSVNINANNISTNNIALNTINSVAYSPFYTGMIIPYAGDNGLIPSLPGWVYCNGQILDGTNPVYAALYALIGIRYGGTSSTAFAVPDFRSRTIFGAMSGGYIPSPFTFQIFGTGFFHFTLSAPPPNTIPPGNLPYNQCIAVNFIEAGFELGPGMLLRCANPAIDPNTYIIQDIINYPGGSGTYGSPVSTYPVIILTTPMLVVLNNTDLIIENGNTFIMGQQTRTNYTTQDPLQVALHTHLAFADTVPNVASGAGPVTLPAPQILTDTGYNEPNLRYRIGTGAAPGAYYESTKPAGTPNIPSNVAVNFIIKT